jgi:MFS family permease
MNDSNSDQGLTQANYYLWIVLPLVAVAQLTQALIRVGLPVLYPFIQTEFGLSHAQVGMITSALAVGYATAVIFAGRLSDVFGVKRTIIIATLAMTVFTLGFPLAYSFPVVLILVVLIAMTACGVHPATTKAIMDWFPNRIRGLAMSIKQTGVPAAGALTAAVLPALALIWGWRISAASTALIILFTAIAFILFYHDAPRGIQPERKFNLTILKNILRNRDLFITIFWGAVFVGLQFSTLSYFVLFLIEELEWSPVIAGGMLAIAQVTSIIARVILGAASDFIFHGRRIAVLAITGFLTTLWMLGISVIDAGVPSIIVYSIAIAIGISTLSFHGVFHTLCGEQSEAGQIGMTIGLVGAVTHISMMIMPPLFGYFVDIIGSYSHAWRAAAGLALVCTLGLLVFGKERRDF